MDLAEWIRLGRRNLGITQGELGDRIGVVQTTISKWEKGKSEPSRSEMDRLEREFGAPYISVAATTNPQALQVTIPVMGYVGRDRVVVFQDQEPEKIELPPGAPADACAIVVRGSNLWPFKDGTVLLYWTWSDNPGAFLGETCLIELADGTYCVRDIMRGSTGGTWTLAAGKGEPVIRDVRVKRAALIEATFRKPLWVTSRT